MGDSRLCQRRLWQLRHPQHPETAITSMASLAQPRHRSRWGHRRPRCRSPIRAGSRPVLSTVPSLRTTSPEGPISAVVCGTADHGHAEPDCRRTSDIPGRATGPLVQRSI